MEELINRLEELRIEIKDIYPNGFKPTEDDKFAKWSYYRKLNFKLSTVSTVY